MNTIKMLMVLFVLLLHPAIVVADVNSGDGESDCHEAGEVALDVQSILTGQLGPLASSPVYEIPALITPKLITALGNAEQCARDIASARVADKAARTERGCDIFMLSVSLGGLREHLEKVHECAEKSCNAETLAINRDVIKMQMGQLEVLVGGCLGK